VRKGKALEGGSLNQRLVNGERSEGLSEVGLPHSSGETGESQWSEGGNKSAFPGNKTWVTQEVA